MTEHKIQNKETPILTNFKFNYHAEKIVYYVEYSFEQTIYDIE